MGTSRAITDLEFFVMTTTDTTNEQPSLFVNDLGAWVIWFRPKGLRRWQSVASTDTHPEAVARAGDFKSLRGKVAILERGKQP